MRSAGASDLLDWKARTEESPPLIHEVGNQAEERHVDHQKPCPINKMRQV